MNRDQLIALRKRLGLTQLVVARMADIERSRFNLWERGHINVSNAERDRIAHVLAQERDLIKAIPVPEAVAQ
jgi:transcriptional regulator with XRE-family HTH domain